MRRFRFQVLLLALSLLFTLAACKPVGEEPSNAPSEAASEPATPSAEPAPRPTQEPSGGITDVEPGPDTRIAVLSGPTGVGAAKLLDNIDNNPAALRRSGYSYTIANDNS